MKRYLIIANLILVAGIAYFGVQAAYRIATLPLETGVRPAVMGHPAEPAAEAAPRPAGFYQVIVNRNLFDTRPQEPSRQAAFDLQDLAQTGLKLKLWGTVSGAGQGQAYAVIEDDRDKRQRLYHQGEEIQGATIRMILREKVVLTVNGRDEFLGMEKPLAGPADSPPAAPEPEPEDTSASQQIRLQSDQIRAAMGNLHTLAQQATIRPNFNKGRRDGFLFSRVQPNSVFSQIGLQSGDIIKSVDGQPISSVGQALTLYQNLSPGSEVEVQITRQGTDRKIRYAIE